MPASPKHSFGAPVLRHLGSVPRGRVSISLLSAIALGILVAQPATSQAPVKITATPAASVPWLDRLNTWRGASGVPGVTENTLWSAGDAAHAQYMVKNDLVTHYETPGVPYYSVAGDTAARNSNIYVSSSTGTADTQAIDWWAGAPFHSMGLMDPRMAQSGFGSYRDTTTSPWQMGAAVDVSRGDTATGLYPVFFPGNGAQEPLTSYSGNEFPDPLSACPGYTMPAGLPVWVEVGANVATVASSHSFTGNGVPLAHCVIDSTNSAVGSNLKWRGGVIVVPKAPLQSGVNYVVALTVNGVPYTWSFTVGPFITSTAPCLTAGLTADKTSPQNPGALVTFTATSTGCPNPQYLFYLQSPGGAWTIMRNYGGPTWTWNTASVPSVGTYVVNVWVRDTGSGVPVQINHLLPFVLGSATPCTGAGLASSMASPVEVDYSITFTATSSTCPNPQYLFYLQSPGGAWSIARGYGGPVWTWDTSTVASIGSYNVNVWVRDAGSTVAVQANFIMPYTLTNRVCTSAGLASDKASPQVHGAVITFTGTSAGCARPEYLFYLKGAGATGTWSVVKGYDGNTWSWNTAGLALGTYEVNVWVRAVGSAVAVQTNATMNFALT